MLIYYRYDGLTLPQIFEIIKIATRWSGMNLQNATQVRRSEQPQNDTVVPLSRFHVMHNGYQIASFEMEAGKPVHIYHPDISAHILAEMGLGGELINMVSSPVL